MARYNRKTILAQQGFPSNLDQIQEIASVVNSQVFISAILDGLNLKFQRFDGTEFNVNMATIAGGGNGNFGGVTNATLNGNVLELTNIDATTTTVDLSPLNYLVTPTLNGSDLVFTDSLGNTISVNLSTFDQSSDILSLQTRVSNEESTRSNEVSSLTTRISAAELNTGSADFTSVDLRVSTNEDGITSLTGRVSSEEFARLYADASLTSRVSAEEVARASAVASVEALQGSGVSSLTGRISTNEDGITSLTGRLSTEEVSRLNGDSSLEVRLSGEESTRLVVDSSLETRISNVEANGGSVDTTSIDTRFIDTENIVSSEASVRLSSDNSIVDKINVSVSNLANIDASIQNRLSTEESTRLTSDSSLSSRISTEESTRFSLGLSLETRISNAEGNGGSADFTSIDLRVSNEESVRLSVDTSLNSRIADSEVSVANNETSINSIDTKLSNAIVEITSIENSTSTVESTIISNLDVEESTRVLQVSSIDTRLSLSDVGNDSLVTRISNVEVAAVYDDTSIETRISIEESTRVSNDNSLETRFNNISGSTYNDSSINNRVSLETSARISADDSLNDRITATATNQQGTIAILSGEVQSIDDVVTGATSNVSSLETRISAVESSAYNDSSINTRVSDTEDDITSVDVRINNIDSIDTVQNVSITSLETRISSEESTRLSSDSSVNTVTNSLVTRISNEESTRQSSDSSLDARFNNISGSTYNDTSINTRVSAVESEVDSIVSAGIGVNLSSLSGHIIPDTNETRDLGTAEKKFRHLYLSSNSIYLADTQISYDADEGKVTMGGNPVPTNEDVASIATAYDNTITEEISTVKASLATKIDEDLSVAKIELSTQIEAGDLALKEDVVTVYYTNQVAIAQNTYTVTEGNSLSVAINRTLTGVADAQVDKVLVDYVIMGIDATLNDDYTSSPTSGTIEFLPDETIKYLTINTVDDNIVEGTEQLGVYLSNPRVQNSVKVVSGGTINLGTTGSTVNIVDNDTYRPATVQFTTTTASITEGDLGTTKNLTLTITRSLGSGSVNPTSTTIDYITTNGTASAGSDYTATSGTLEFTGSETSKTINIPIIGNNTVDGNRTFTVSLQNPGSDTTFIGGNSTVTATIVDNDSYKTSSYTITGTSLTEGNSGSKLATITVSRTFTGGNLNPGNESIEYFTEDNTATAGSDYTTTSGTLTFTDADIVTSTNGGSKTFTVPVAGDDTIESAETFYVKLRNVTSQFGNPVIGTSSDLVTIVNDDQIQTSQFNINQSSYSITEGDTGTQTITIQVNRVIGSGNVSPTGNLTVNYNTIDITALNGQDYVGVSGTLDFTNATVQTVDITINGDTNYEGNETFQFRISNPQGQGTSLGSITASTITIIDNDPVPTTTTTTVAAGATSYLVYADEGSSNGQILYNGSNSTFYPFGSSGITDFDSFITTRLNSSDRISSYTHDVCADKANVTFNLAYVGETTSSQNVAAYYFHPSSQGTVSQLIDINTNTTYGVTPSSGQSVTIDGNSYTMYRWLAPQTHGTTFSIKVNAC